MFIREKVKQNKNPKKVYHAHFLVESIRTVNGPRQRTILKLGTLSLPKEKWKALANRIEEIYLGSQNFLQVDPEVEPLASHFARLLIQQKIAEKQQAPQEDKGGPDYLTVDVSELSSSPAKSVGAEHVGVHAMQQLGFFDLFKELDLTRRQSDLATLSIVGRLVHPCSENELKRFAKENSALDLILNTDFSRIGQNELYNVSDLLFENKEHIESFLRNRAKKVFCLKETIILYDLTNTHFEGAVKQCSKAHRGRSKQKQHQRPLVTLGLVMDELGFLKSSKTFDGNVVEAHTFQEMIKDLHQQSQGLRPVLPLYKPTVVMDAGIATEENLAFLKEQNFAYIVVSRKKYKEIPEGEAVSVKDGVTVKSFTQDDEVILHCQSQSKEQKEQGIVTKAKDKMEAELKALREGLSQKNKLKKYVKVLEKIGKLRKQYSRVSKAFEINVTQDEDLAVDLVWTYDPKKLGKPYDGSYFLRTSRTDLDPARIWEVYIMLTILEGAFRHMKSELGLRPNFHRKEDRIEGHMFITVLAYHLLHWIGYRLKKAGMCSSWTGIRETLDTHRLLTTSMPVKDGGIVSIRHCTTPTVEQAKIYNVLGASGMPIKKTKVVTKQK
ncbi:IS1634 family transposase [Desulfonatronum parangueonense]